MSWTARLLRRFTGGRQPSAVAAGEGYSRWAPSYGRPTNELQRLEHEILIPLLPDMTGRSVLDFGCGTGRTSRLCVERQAALVVGFDLSLGMLVHGERDLEGVPRVVARIEQAPVGGASFDVVLCNLVLGHVATLQSPLRALCGAVSDGGALLISDFHPLATKHGFERTFNDGGRLYSIDQYAHSIDDYRSHLDTEGFEVDAFEERAWRGTPVLFALRARRRGASG